MKQSVATENDISDFIYRTVAECATPPLVVSETAIRQLRPALVRLYWLEKILHGDVG